MKEENSHSKLKTPEKSQAYKLIAQHNSILFAYHITVDNENMKCVNRNSNKKKQELSEDNGVRLMGACLSWLQSKLTYTWDHEI